MYPSIGFAQCFKPSCSFWFSPRRRFRKRPLFCSKQGALWVLGMLLCGMASLADAAKPVPTPIDGPPVAPPILDKPGDGLCASVRQATYTKTRSGAVFNADNVFGNENTSAPRACYQPNFTNKGSLFPGFIDKFFNGDFFPLEAGGFITNDKVSLLNLSNCPACPGGSMPGIDPNGDFLINRAFNVEGDPFPAIKLPNFLKCIDPNNAACNINLRYSENPTNRSFPEARATDQIRDTALRINGYLNVTQDWVDNVVEFGTYANDGIAVTIFDKFQNPYVILSLSTNRCEPCVKKNAVCGTTDTSGQPLQCQADNGWCQPCLYSTYKYGTSCPLCANDTQSCDQNLICRLEEMGERWRATVRVRFYEAGLYPIQIVYVQHAGNAALELAYRLLNPGSPGADIYDSWGYPPDTTTPPENTYNRATKSVSLATLGFRILEPTRLFQSITGNSIDCKAGQCNPRKPNVPNDQMGCGPGSGTFCNPAGICEPCNTKDACGNSCAPCPNGQQCVDQGGGIFGCFDCVKNSDCKNGQSCIANQCVCQNDNQCEKGLVCRGQACVPCGPSSGDPNMCAGNSCQCCPGGTFCAPPDAKNPNRLACIECVDDSNCTPGTTCCKAGFTCDTMNNRCVPVGQLAACRSDSKCGPSCTPCPADHPFCSNGQTCVQCRSDLDCGAGNYCLSGTCVDCTADKKCGLQCRSCTPDLPFCASKGTAATAQCVQCTQDSQCGTNGKCDPNTNTCTNPCSVACPPGQFCMGTQCVECVSNVQCGCGKTCNESNHKCEPGCQDTADCRADECCSSLNNACERRICAAELTLSGTTVTTCTVAPTGIGSPSLTGRSISALVALWLGLFSLVLWQRRTRKTLHSVSQGPKA